MGGGTNILSRHPTARGYCRQRFTCGATRAKSPVTTYLDANGARPALSQQGSLQSLSDGATQHFQQSEARHHADLTAISLDHCGVVLLHDTTQPVRGPGIAGPHAQNSTEPPPSAVLQHPSLAARQPDPLVCDQLPELADAVSGQLSERYLQHNHHQQHRQHDHHHRRHSLQTFSPHHLHPVHSSEGHHLVVLDAGCPANGWQATQGLVGASCVEGSEAVAAGQPPNHPAEGGLRGQSSGAGLPPYLDASSRSSGVASTSQAVDQDGGPAGAHRRAQKLGNPVTSPSARKPPKKWSKAKAPAAAAVPGAAAASSSPDTPELRASGGRCDEASSGGPAGKAGGSVNTKTGAAGLRIVEAQPLDGSPAPVDPAIEAVQSQAGRLPESFSGAEAAVGAVEIAAENALPTTPAAPRPKPPRAPTRAQHEQLRKQAAMRRKALLPRDPTVDDLRLTARVVSAAHWRDVLVFAYDHKERYERNLAEQRQREQEQQEQQQQLQTDHPWDGELLSEDPGRSDSSTQRQSRPPAATGPSEHPQQQQQLGAQGPSDVRPSESSRRGTSPAPPDRSRPESPIASPLGQAPPGLAGSSPPVPIALLPFTPQHVVVILHRTVQLLDLHGGPVNRAEAVQLQGMIDGLARLAGVMLDSPSMSLREISLIMYSLTRLRWPVRKPYLLAVMQAARDRFVLEPPPPPRPVRRKHKFGNKGWKGRKGPKGGSEQQMEPPQPPPSDAPEGTKSPDTACHLALLIWSISRCGMKGLRVDWAREYCTALGLVVPDLTSQGVAIVLYGMARLKFQPPAPLAAALCERLSALAGREDADRLGGLDATPTSPLSSRVGPELPSQVRGQASDPAGVQQPEVDAMARAAAAASTMCLPGGQAGSLQAEREPAAAEAVPGTLSHDAGAAGCGAPSEAHGGGGHARPARGARREDTVGRSGRARGGAGARTQGALGTEGQPAAAPDADVATYKGAAQGGVAADRMAASAAVGTVGSLPYGSGHCTDGESLSPLGGSSEDWDAAVAATVSHADGGELGLPSAAPAPSHHLCRPTDVSMSLWACATLGVSPADFGPEFLPAVLRYSQARMLDFREQELSNMVWALARLQHAPSPEWLACLRSAVQKQVPHLGPQALSTILYGMEQLGQRPEQGWMRAVGERLQTLLPWCCPQSLALSVHALAVMGFRPERSWLAAFHSRLESYRGQLDNRARDKVRVAYQVLGFRPNGGPGPAAQSQSAPASTVTAPAAARRNPGLGASSGAGARPHGSAAGTNRPARVTTPSGGSSGSAGDIGGTGRSGAGQRGTSAEPRGMGTERPRPREGLLGQEGDLAWELGLLEDGALTDAGGTPGQGSRPEDEAASQVLVRPSRFV